MKKFPGVEGINYIIDYGYGKVPMELVSKASTIDFSIHQKQSFQPQ